MKIQIDWDALYRSMEMLRPICRKATPEEMKAREERAMNDLKACVEPKNGK